MGHETCGKITDLKESRWRVVMGRIGRGKGVFLSLLMLYVVVHSFQRLWRFLELKA